MNQQPFSPVPLGYEQQLVVATIGDTKDGLLMRWVGVVWDRYGYLTATWPQLQRLYTQRDLLQMLWGRIRLAVSFSIAAAGGGGGSTSVSLSDRMRYLSELRAEVLAEIERLESYWRASQAPAVGTLRQLAPIMPPWPGMFDANSPLLTGSAYRTLGTWDGMPRDTEDPNNADIGMYVPTESPFLTNDGW